MDTNEEARIAGRRVMETIENGYVVEIPEDSLKI